MKRHFKLLLAAVFTIAASATATAQQGAQQLPLDPDVRYGKLENGLTYYIRHNEEPKDRVHFYIAQKVGSVQEDESQRGLAHFLEHMCFNGSVNFPEDGSLISYCESIGVKFGANLNAYTSTDETVYNIDDIPVNESNIDKCLLILHDWADGLLLEDEQIDKERGVIHEEWRMRTVGQQRILERALPKLYPGSKYAYRMPIGTMEVVDNFPPEVLRAYYEKWYRPDLQGIVIVGDIDVDSIEAKVKDVFGPIRMPENPAKYEFYPVPANEEPIYVIDSDKEVDRPLILAMFKDEPMPMEMNNTIAYFAQNYITKMISDILNSRLGEASQKPDCPFIAGQVDYGKYLVAKTMNCFEVVIIPKPGQDAAAVQAVMSEIERARRFGFTDTELIRAREEFLSQLEMLYDNRTKQKNGYYVQKYVRHFIDNDAFPGIENVYQIYKMLAPQIPAQALNQTFAQLAGSITSNFAFLAMYPEKEGFAVPTEAEMKGAVEAARAADLEAYVDNVKNEPLIPVLPKMGKIKKESVGPFGYTKLSLANGANVYYLKTDYNDSQVLMSARSFGGTSLTSVDDVVNANLTSMVINASGLGNFNSVELEKALAGKQAGVSVNLTAVTEGLTGHSSPKDLRTLFELIYLRFQAPADDPDAYNNMMAGLRSQLENASKLPMSAFQDSINVTVYGNNPRARSIHLEDLDKADYAKIKSIYSDRFKSAGDFDFFFTGNFDEDSLRTFVRQYIAPLKKMGKRETYIDWNLYPTEGMKTNRFNRQMETPQGYVLQLWSGTNPHDIKEGAIVSATGSILSKRYLKTIREDGGMAYTVQSSAEASFGTREDYIIQTVCPFTPELCDTVLYLINKEIEDIAENGVTDEELENVRKFELKQYSDNQRNNSYWQEIVRSMVLWGKDVRTGYEDAVKSITSDDIKAFMRDVVVKQGNCTTVVMLPEGIR